MPATPLILKTPAKLNWFLNVRGQRADGYHEICSVMQALNLFDTLTITPDWEAQSDQNSRITLTCNWPELAENPEENLVVKAYHLFWQKAQLPPLPLRVHLEKQIPLQAGLGGGSANAAAMLLALNHLSLANMPLHKLQQIAAKLGSDVPFFLVGGTAFATGRGEFIQPIFPPACPDMPTGEDETQSDSERISLYEDPIWSMVIIKPKKLQVSTSKAYQSLIECNNYKTVSPETLLNAFKQNKTPEQMRDLFLNDFESVTFGDDPEMVVVLRLLETLGIKRPLLCGSGAALAVFYPDTPSHRLQLPSYFPSQDYDLFWVRPWLQGIVQEKAMASAVSESPAEPLQAV